MRLSRTSGTLPAGSIHHSSPTKGYRLRSSRRRGSRPFAVTVHPDGVGRYRQDVESAVYFCCLEALNNVAKYAQAAHVNIRSGERRRRAPLRGIGRRAGLRPLGHELRDRAAGDGRPTGRAGRIDRGRQRSRRGDEGGRAPPAGRRRTMTRRWPWVVWGLTVILMAITFWLSRDHRLVLGGSVLPERGDRDDRRVYDDRRPDREPHRTEPDRLAPDADRGRLPPRRVHRRVPPVRDPTWDGRIPFT